VYPWLAALLGVESGNRQEYRYVCACVAVIRRSAVQVAAQRSHHPALHRVRRAIAPGMLHVQRSEICDGRVEVRPQAGDGFRLHSLPVFGEALEPLVCLARIRRFVDPAGGLQDRFAAALVAQAIAHVLELVKHAALACRGRVDRLDGCAQAAGTVAHNQLQVGIRNASQVKPVEQWQAWLTFPKRSASSSRRSLA